MRVGCPVTHKRLALQCVQMQRIAFSAPSTKQLAVIPPIRTITGLPMRANTLRAKYASSRRQYEDYAGKLASLD